MKVTITGGAGFIGRSICEKILTNNKVTIIDDFSNSNIDNINKFQNNNKFAIYKETILNKEAVKESLKDSDLCIHLAAKINVQESLDTPFEHLNTNYLGTYNVLEECRRQDVKLIIFGTCMVYDLASNIPINETHPVLPKSPYAATKLAAEELAISYYHGYGLPVSIVRVFNTYGPYQKSNSEGGVVSIFIKKYLQGEKIQIYGQGDQTRDLLFVEDCAEFVENVLQKGAFKGEIYNAGSGSDISINKLAELICPDKSRIEHIPHIHPQSEIMKLVCDYSKSQKELGWEPKTSLTEGIKKTMDWMRSTL